MGRLLVAKTKEEARRIYQLLLDQIGEAIRDGNFDAYQSYFQLPHHLETSEAKTIVETPEQLRVMFQEFRKRLKLMGVTGLSRDCSLAEFHGPDTIKGCHETRIITPDNRLLDAYMALSTLVYVDGIWLVSDSQYAEDGTSLPSKAVRAKERYKP